MTIHPFIGVRVQVVGDGSAGRSRYLNTGISIDCRGLS